ncbi:hypothetical protein B7463_g6061, partial [Scytalidium lignicola]
MERNINMTMETLIGNIPKYVFPKLAFDDIAVLALLGLGSTAWLLNGKLWNKSDPYNYLWFERPQQTQVKAKESNAETRDTAKKLAETKKDIIILWGSQSGTAESFAERLRRDLRQRFGINALCADLSDFDPQTIEALPSSKVAIFLLSTYGEGNPSDNSVDFCDWLKTASISLANLRYIAFGLGNSNYKFYNRVVDSVVQKLDEVGAESLLPVGRADDAQGNTEEDFCAWKEKVFKMLCQRLNLSEKNPEYEPTINIQPVASGNIFYGVPIMQSHARQYISSIQALPVKQSRELYANGDRRCLHIEIDLSMHQELKYKTGDHLGIWPINPENEISQLLEILGLTATKDEPISISALDSSMKLKVPTQTTVDALFRHYLEICAPVSRETIHSLAQFAPTETAREHTRQLGDSSSVYATLQTHSYITINRLLRLAGGESEVWNIPLSYLIEVLPAMTPRYYSISSSSVVQPRQAAITVSVSTRSLSNNATEVVPGLATNYLLALKQSLNPVEAEGHPQGLTYSLDGPQNVLAQGKVHVHIRRSTFKLPIAASHPIIMVAAGTGIAPFRGFLQERMRLELAGREVGKMYLFFGCRNRNEDFLYRDEIETFQATLGNTLTVVTAFSREEKVVKTSRMYIQDRIKERMLEIGALLGNADTHFYVCGAASMARDVSKVIGQHLSDANGLDGDQITEWFERQKKVKAVARRCLGLKIPEAWIIGCVDVHSCLVARY